ncbi:MAG: helix-turn-helix transcriptional regulator [Streptosporangiaceae bacterium]
MAGSRSVLRQLSDGLAELYAPASTPGGLDYAARVVSLAARLVPADSCSYNHIGGGDALLAWLIEPADVGTFPGGVQLLKQHLPEHPVLTHVRATGDGRARRISDFLSDRQFRALGLYHDFYRRCGVDYQVAISVPAPGGGLIGIALNRQRHDFFAADLELLDLLRIHVGQAAGIALLTQPGPAGPPDAAATPPLTPRQARILQLVADGQSDRGIARTLGISTRTVQAHLQHTYRALDVTSRTEAVARLRALGAAAGLSRTGRLARW